MRFIVKNGKMEHFYDCVSCDLEKHESEFYRIYYFIYDKSSKYIYPGLCKNCSLDNSKKLAFDISYN